MSELLGSSSSVFSQTLNGQRDLSPDPALLLTDYALISIRLPLQMIKELKRLSLTEEHGGKFQLMYSPDPSVRLKVNHEKNHRYCNVQESITLR